MISTNINEERLRDSGFKFKYSLEDSYRDWFEDCNKEYLK